MHRAVGSLVWAGIWFTITIGMVLQFFFLDFLGGYVVAFPFPLYFGIKELIYYFKSPEYK